MKRIDQITFLRYIAAIAVVVYHYGREVVPFHQGVLHKLFSQAYTGVSFFFVLSGFVMVIAYYKDSKKNVDSLNYYKNRFARIYPVYMFAQIIFILDKYATGYSVNMLDLTMNSALLHAWHPEFPLSLNYPSWSLSVEFFFYLTFPFVLNRMLNKDSKLLVPLIIAIWVISQAFVGYFYHTPSMYTGEFTLSHNFLFYFPVFHLNQFLVGILAGYIYMKKYKSMNKNFTIYSTLLAFAILAALVIGGDGWRASFNNGILAPLFCVFIIVFAIDNGIVSRLFSHKFTVLLGEISYGIYILHVPVKYWVDHVFNKTGIENAEVRFFLYLILLTLVSYLSYIWIEVPLRNRIKKMKIKSGFNKIYSINKN
ncbi:MAG: acyltransferase [Bacteroidales bacterium]|nr:acyltransferase [Bacteroidales bacterium]